jgi:membrane protease YdiL (CAAX protease family)
MINYKLIIFIYSSVLLLLLISTIRDRFIPHNELLKSQKWSLIPGIIVLTLSIGGVIIQSLWNYIPILKNYLYNPFNWDIFSLFWMCFILIIVYIFLRYVYKVSIIKVFGLQTIYLPFILKLCGVLTIINILSIYYLDFNLILHPGKELEGIIKSMDIPHFILFSLVTIIVSPIGEEIVSRGLIYVPLYRKLGRYLAIILSSLIFAHAHFFEALLPSFGIFIKGLIFGWLYDRSGSLIHPIILHIFINSWVLVYYFNM